MAGDERVHRDRLKQLRMDIASLITHTNSPTVKAKWKRHMDNINEVIGAYCKEPEK